MYKKSNKIIASMLVFILTLTQLSLIGIHGREVYASEENLEAQTTKTNNENVEFDTYFLVDEEEKHASVKNISEENFVYAKILVNDTGYLKDAKIQFKSAENETSNFKVVNKANSDVIQKIDEEENAAILNQINSGKETTVEIPIAFNVNSNEVLLSEFLKESKAVLTATYADGNGNEKSIEKEITLKLGWSEAEVESILTQEVNKFAQITVNNEETVILQTIIKSGIVNNTLPIKNTSIEVKVPTINGIKPQEVKVYANTTKATNSDQLGYYFSNENYTYSQENQTLTINVKNVADENGKIKWEKQAVDEYIVTYLYGKDVKESITEDVGNATLEVKSKIELYDGANTSLTKEVKQDVTLKDQVGQIIDVSMEELTQTLSKGYIYANYVAEQKIETTYNEKLAVNIGLVELAGEKIVLEQNEEYFTSDAGKTKYPTTMEDKNYTYYKSISVNKNMIKKLLGENAQIKIYSGETLIETINKEVIDEAEETILVNVSEKDINSIKIEISKPQTEGKLVFDIQKAIKAETDYTKEQMQEIEALSLSYKIGESLVNGTINFVEPETKAQISIDKTELSTVTKNENVKMTVTLKTDSENNNLFKNPKITIQLPKYVEAIELKSVELMHDENLKIEGKEIVNNADGSKSIVITIKGEQTKYSIGSVTGGASIFIIADITVNKFTSNRQEEIKMTYTNENVITEAGTVETKETKIPVTFVAPVGVITTNSIENYAQGQEKLTSLSGDQKTALIETMVEARDVKFEANIINNYNNTIDDVKVLGRLPFKGNKNLQTSEDLGSSFDMTLKSEVIVSGIEASRVKIYYSTNGNATQDLENTENAWNLSPENYENVKSYLIVVEGKLNTADALNVSYTANLPASLQFNETTVENYIVYFTNNLETGAIEDKQMATPIIVTTGKGPILEVEMSANYTQSQIVTVGNDIQYTIKIKNTGTMPAQNVVAKLPIPSGIFISRDSESYELDYSSDTVIFNIGNINVGEEVENKVNATIVSFVEEDINYIKKIKARTTVTAENINYEIVSNEVTNSAKQVYFKIVNEQSQLELDLSEKDEFEFYIMVNTSSNTRVAEDTIIKIPLPEGLAYKSAQFDDGTTQGITYNEKERTIQANAGSVSYTEAKVLNVKVQVEKLNANEYSKIIKVYAMVSAKDIAEETSAIKEYTVRKIGLEASQTSNIPEGSYIQEGDSLSYIITIKNIGKRIVAVNFKNEIPEGLSFSNMEYTINGEKITSTLIVEGTVNEYILLGEGEIATVKVNAIVGALDKDTQISNKPEITVESAETQFSVNEVKHIIEKRKVQVEDEDVENPEVIDGKQISGIIWKDESKNGMYDTNETVFSDVEVLLLNTDTNKVFSQRARTNANGVYTFSNVARGNYIAIFLYDTGKYSATTYEAEGVDQTVNSNAIDTKIRMDGEERAVAVTDTIVVDTNNIYNINLGLIDSPKFDLSLNKTISKITVQTPEEVKAYEYDGESLTKVEFVEKYLGQTTMVVEYKITVKNEGAIDGYVKKIVDYLPEGMSFNTELNRDWYMAENGTIYNASLANTKIAAGETKEVTLTLTKQVNAESLGRINNTAEIFEAYNDKGIADYDSTAGNKASNEDDISSADMVLSIKTGKEIMFIGLTLSILTILGISAYFIKKKVLI